RTYFRLQKAILALGFLATFLAVIETNVKQSNFATSYPVTLAFLHYLIICVPAAATIMVGALTVFKPGVRWVLLRSGAEAIKREIYQCRTGVGNYKVESTADENLSLAVNNISDMVEVGDLENFALTPYPYTDGSDGVPLIPKRAADPADDGMSL